MLEKKSENGILKPNGIQGDHFLAWAILRLLIYGLQIIS